VYKRQKRAIKWKPLRVTARRELKKA